MAGAFGPFYLVPCGGVSWASAVTNRRDVAVTLFPLAACCAVQGGVSAAFALLHARYYLLDLGAPARVRLCLHPI